MDKQCWRTPCLIKLDVFKLKPMHGNPRILVVDDEEDLLILMENILTSENYAVDVCLNGENLQHFISERRPDIVLLDIRMNGVSGMDICSGLKKDAETRDIPILLFSANHDIETIASQCGADGFLTKPFDKKAAKEKFDSILGDKA